MRYHGADGLLADVVVSGGVVSDHLSILDVNTSTNAIDLRTSHTHTHTPAVKSEI